MLSKCVRGRTALALVVLRCFLCDAQLDVYYDPLPEAYWADAVVKSVPPGDLSPLWNGLGSGKYQWNLQTGEYQLGTHVAATQFAASVRLVGAGVNQTFIQCLGHQNMLALQAKSKIAIESASLTGVTPGFVHSGTPATSTTPDLFPRFYLARSEWWGASSDVVSKPSGYVTTFFKLALESGTITLLDTADNAAESDIQYTDNEIIFSDNFLFRTVTDAFGYGALHLYFANVTQRASPDTHEMEDLFNQLVTKNGLGRTDCWNANDEDLGFTYRGSVATTTSGFACKSWDDSSTFPSVNVPTATGFSSTERNYCRSPRFWQGGPWCFTTNPNIATGWEECDLPMCSGTGPNATVASKATASDEVVRVGKQGLAVGAVVGIVIGCLVGVLLLLGAAWWLFFWKPPLAVVDDLWFNQPGQYDAPDKSVITFNSTQRQPWHVGEVFESTLHDPPLRDGILSLSADSADGSLTTQVQFMMEQCHSVDSLALRHLEYKYGPKWASENSIDTTRLIGEGGIGKVYAGTRNGVPVAYKVINQMKTPDAMLRFVRKCVLPVVNVQLLPTFPTTNPHLLQLYDCLMFPQYYSLLALTKGHDTDNLNSSNSPTGSAAKQASPKAGAGPPTGVTANVSVLKNGSVRPPMQGAKLAKALTREDSGGLSKGNGGGLSSTTTNSRRLSGDDFEDCDPEKISTDTVFFSVQRPDREGAADANSRDSRDGNIRDAPRSKVPAPESMHVSSTQSSGSSNSEREPLAPRTGGTDGKPGSNGPASGPRQRTPTSNSSLQSGEGAATRDIVAQIIMVSPLCELGTLTDLLRGRAQIPVRALPVGLRGSMAFHLSKSLQVGEVHSINENTPCTSLDFEIPSTVTINDLPTIWQLILKLQLSLQVIDGISALHAVSLVHCDIKLDNVFLTASSHFEPFGICAKVGDLDTCRSLKGAHLPGAAADVQRPKQPAAVNGAPNGAAGGKDQNGPLPGPFTKSWTSTLGPNIHFTSCMKGTPGYLAPEMIICGRVTTETDVFSLAVTVSIMLADRAQFHKRNDLHMKLVADFPPYLDVALTQCLTECLNVQPDQRPAPSFLKALLEFQLQSCLKALQESQAQSASEKPSGPA